MGMEIIVVMAHAMGRTLALPPAQHLYLLGKTHKDEKDKEEHDEMGFEDFFDIDLLKSHKGSHIITMNEFLEREAVTGGLKGILPPGNKSDLWGQELWNYLWKVADVKPAWYGRYLAMPDKPENFNLSSPDTDPKTLELMKSFGGDRRPVFYEKELELAHHIHFAAREEYRLLQHHYCHELVQAVRADARASVPEGNGSLVYISTDDPDGICANCYVQRQPCTSYKPPKPVGCPEPTSWDAFTEFGWKIRFLNGYLKDGVLNGVNPNLYGMAESIVCSRAKVFAGTFYSTFTGYIHRLRGYHGIGEDSYYHTNHELMVLRKPKSQGHGFFREWRAGWTDDNGGLI
eukprot:gene20551-26654_t